MERVNLVPSVWHVCRGLLGRKKLSAIKIDGHFPGMDMEIKWVPIWNPLEVFERARIRGLVNHLKLQMGSMRVRHSIDIDTILPFY